MLVAASLAVATAALAQADPTAPARSTACESPRIGFLGPVTGAAAFIGKEQLGFSRYAIRRLARGTIKLVEEDTQLSPARAARAGARLHANRDVLAVVGPAGSQEVLAVAPIFMRADRLPFISASAVAAALTNGSIPNFLRVVPSAAVQPATIAMNIRLAKATDVLIVDDRTAYSRPLADGVQSRLRRDGVTVTRRSVDAKLTDFKALVATIGPRIDIVFLPWQLAANAQLFGRELEASGPAGRHLRVGRPRLGRLHNRRLVRVGVRHGHQGARGQRPLHRRLRLDVRLQLRPARLRGHPGGDRGDREGVRGRRRNSSRGAEEPAGDVHPEHRPRRPPPLHPHGDREGARFSVFRLGKGGKKTLVG